MAAAVVVVALAAFACGDDGDDRDARAVVSPVPTSPSASPTFARTTALLDTDEGSTLIDVEVAETDAQRQLGLMNRESLPEDAGMVFIWFEEASGPFWMKDTLIPLSIAFFDLDGKILKILDMEPCEAEPCELYDPGVSYRGALEVNQGAFDEWGVEEGDFIRLNR